MERGSVSTGRALWSKQSGGKIYIGIFTNRDQGNEEQKFCNKGGEWRRLDMLLLKSGWPMLKHVSITALTGHMRQKTRNGSNEPGANVLCDFLIWTFILGWITLGSPSPKFSAMIPQLWTYMMENNLIYVVGLDISAPPLSSLFAAPILLACVTPVRGSLLFHRWRCMFEIRLY